MSHRHMSVFVIHSFFTFLCLDFCVWISNFSDSHPLEKLIFHDFSFSRFITFRNFQLSGFYPFGIFHDRLEVEGGGVDSL